MNISVDLITFIMGKQRTVTYIYLVLQKSEFYKPGENYERWLIRKNKYRQKIVKAILKLFNKNLWDVQKPHLIIKK